MHRNLILSISTLALACHLRAELPDPDAVIARVMEHDRELQSSLDGYTGQRRYVLENARHHKRAEMLVRV